VTNSAQPVPASLSHFVIAARDSRFTVQAFATGLLSGMGHNPTIGIRDFSGEVNFNPAALEGNGFHLTIRAASLTVEDDISDKDRREIERMMNEQILEVTRYPEIVYDAPMVRIEKMGDSLYTANLEGSLSLHGVTQRLPVVARIAVFASMVRASGNFTLHQSGYQIKPFSFAGGALKLKDELKFNFEIVAREQA
jgi:polyisoprenoid-binding protein YceI